MVDSVKFGPAKPVPARLSPTATSGGRSAGKGANISSTTVHSLSLASALAQKGPPFDADKIASLRAAIASGSYQTNLGNIADGIVRFGLREHA
jgi:flagellar biosynthesis anti-sigma factor FlgM